MTMPWMCDALLPIEQRYASDKYRRLSRIFNPYKLLRYELIEVRALQLTPGMTRECIDILMQWKRYMQDEYLPVLKELDDEARPLALENAAQATAEDGRAMLIAILEHRPNFGRYVPLYCVRYLQRRRSLGANAQTLAQEFGTTSDRIARWWRQDIHDPLTGELRDRDLVRRGKPVHRSNARILGI